MRRDVIWRYPSSRERTYASCEDFPLGPGVIVTSDNIYSLDEDSRMAYRYLCQSGFPMLSSTNRALKRVMINRPDIQTADWNSLITSPGESAAVASYSYSVGPFIYTISTGLVITLFLTSVLFTKHYITAFKPSWLLKLACLASSIQLIAVNIYSLVELSIEIPKGWGSIWWLLIALLRSTGFNVGYLINFILHLLTQVDIVRRLYPRRREKRAIMVIGIPIVLITEALWACSTFISNTDSASDLFFAVAVSSSQVEGIDDSIAILTVFVFLLEISLSVMFTSLVCVYCWSKRRFAFNRKMFPLTFVTLVAINASFAFFLVDISSLWFSTLSSFFNVVCYVITNVTVWEWLNRLEQFEKHDQKENVLGRQFFTDEYSTSRTYSGGASDNKDSPTALPFAYNRKAGAQYARLKSSLKKYRDDIQKRTGEGLYRMMRDRRQEDSETGGSATGTAPTNANGAAATTATTTASGPHRHVPRHGSNIFIYRPKEISPSEVSTLSSVSRGTGIGSGEGRDTVRRGGSEGEDGIDSTLGAPASPTAVSSTKTPTASLRPSFKLQWMAGPSFLKKQHNVVEHKLHVIGSDNPRGSTEESSSDEEPIELRELDFDGDAQFGYRDHLGASSSTVSHSSHFSD